MYIVISERRREIFNGLVCKKILTSKSVFLFASVSLESAFSFIYYLQGSYENFLKLETRSNIYTNQVIRFDDAKCAL